MSSEPFRDLVIALLHDFEAHESSLTGQEVEELADEVVSLHETSRRPFQDAVDEWAQACFGPEVTTDKAERVHRFVEEALELAQALGCTREDAHMLVDYVFNRPAGAPIQETGGVMVTLAALCNAVEIDMDAAGDLELDRVWTKIDAIREKQRNKPKGSPLPKESKPCRECEEGGKNCTAHPTPPIDHGGPQGIARAEGGTLMPSPQRNLDALKVRHGRLMDREPSMHDGYLFCGCPLALRIRGKERPEDARLRRVVVELQAKNRHRFGIDEEHAFPLLRGLVADVRRETLGEVRAALEELAAPDAAPDTPEASR